MSQRFISNILPVMILPLSIYAGKHRNISLEKHRMGRRDVEEPIVEGEQFIHGAGEWNIRSHPYEDCIEARGRMTNH